MRGFLNLFYIDLRKGRDVVHKPPSCAGNRGGNGSVTQNDKGEYPGVTWSYSAV